MSFVDGSRRAELADALIVGAGPVGILLAYQLARFGCNPYLIEKQDKTVLPCYGRACTVWPRTLEMLDALDLCEGLIQQGTITRSGMHFAEGKRAIGGVTYASRMDRLGDTFYRFGLHIRQSRIESHFWTELKKLGVPMHTNIEFLGYTIHEDEASREYPVEVQVKDLKTDEEYSVFVKHLIACDGASSVVRSLPQTGINFVGDKTTHRWVRMDCRVKTDMPGARNLNSIESPTHGQVLWCPIDSGLTRFGYVFSQKLLDKYGGLDGITQDVVVAEAKAAAAPFKLEFEAVEWWTIYGISQRIAETFISPNSDNRVFLAGDACHTHSSGSAQGLNTGAQDAINLAWKLAFSIKGLTPTVASSLVKSYDPERKEIVQKVIDNDKTISVLISGQYPEQFKGRTESTEEILTQWFNDTTMQAFTLGVGISYPRSPLNYPHFSSFATINAGDRTPDVYLHTIGLNEPIRLLKVLKNTGQFTFVIFAGEPMMTKDRLQKMRRSLLDEGCWLQKKSKTFVDSFRWVSIVASTHSSGAQEVLGMAAPPFDIDFTGTKNTFSVNIATTEGTGSSATKESSTVMKTFISPYSTTTRINQGYVYLDTVRAAHETYGVDVGLGCVLMVRPDGYVAGTVGLDELASPQVGSWICSLLQSS